MKTIQVLKDLVRSAAAATADVTAQIAEMQKRITQLQRAVEFERNTPLPPTDLKPRINTFVEEVGHHWRAEHGGPVIRKLGALDRAEWPFYTDEHVTWGALCAAAPATATAMLEAMVNTPYEAGAPLAKRAALIRQLETELAALEQAEEQAIDAACASGVEIAHRPEVQRRRNQDAERQRLIAEADAESRRRQIVINQRYQFENETRGCGPMVSAYLSNSDRPPRA